MPDPILQYQFFDKDGKAHTIDKQEYDAHSQEFAEQFPEAQMRMVDPDGQSWNIPVSNVGAAMKEGGYRMWRMKVPVKSPERKQEATPTAKPQPVTMPEGFGSLDTRQADKALTGQGRVDWEQKEPEQPDTSARQLTKALKGDKEAAKAVGLDTAGKRMQEEYAYMKATGRPLENIVNTPVTAPTAEVDEDGQMLMGQTTDEQRVAQYQQAEKEKARKRLVADAVDRLQSQMEKEARDRYGKATEDDGLEQDLQAGRAMQGFTQYLKDQSPEELLRRLNEAYGYEDQEVREGRDEELRKQGKSTVLAHWDDKQKNLDFANRFLEDNREAIEDTASRLNMSVDDYVLDELVPSLAGEIAERYGKNMSEKYSVKDTADFLAREMGNSIIGTLATMGATTKKTRQFMQEELQKSREGKGEHYNSNFGTNLAGETLMFAADAVPLMIGGTIGSYTAEGVGKAISALGKKELGALVASGSPFLAANVGKAVKYGGMAAGAMARGIGSMAPFMAASGAVHDMSTGDGTLSSIGKAALEGAWEGAKFGAATGAFGVGSGAAMSKLSGAAKRAALMGASFLVENQIFTGLDYISDPDNFNWSESTENAFYMQLASKFSSAHGVKGVVSKFKSLFAPKAGAPVRLTDTDKESIQRAFAGEDFETIASDVNNIGKILSDKQVIPWTTRMKVAAQTMNTSEPSRPRTSVISITPSKELVERAADGELIEVHKFDTPEQMAEIRQMIEERQANDDMLADFGKLSTMQAQEVTPDIIRLASDEVLQLSPEIRPEDVQPGGKSYDLVIDRAREIANPALDILGQFARDYDMTVGEVRGIMEKRPIERTDEETDLMNELSVRLHEAAYPKGEPHPTQSRIDGESLAGDEPTINPETSTMVAQELEESRQAYLEALGKNEDISSAVRQLEAHGARLDDIYMYVRDNFSGPDADRILESIADYANAQAKQEGYIEKTGSNIDETVNQDIIEKSFHGTIDDAPDEDHIITINRDGESLILINGNIGTRDGVAVDPGKSGGMVIARTEDGRWESFKPDALMTITERVPKDEYGNSIREQMQLDATRTAVETGLFKPETEQPAEKIEETEAGGEAGITNDTGADEPPASPLSRIPVVKDETGQPVLDEEGDAQYQWDKAPLEDTLAALDEISGGDKATVSSIVEDMLTQSAKDVEKASKLTPKGKDPIKIARSAVEIKEQQAEAQRKLDYWTEAKQVLENANKPESELNNQPEKNNEPQNSVALQPKAATPTVEEQKQKRIAEAKEQYGDLFDDDFTKANDVYELASMWVGRKRNLAWEDVNGKRGLQKELGWTRRIGGDTKYIETLLAKNGEGVGIDEFAHMVWESPENDVEGEKRFTSEEIKDAILELLKSAQSKSDVVDYALNTRIEQAKRYLEELKAAEKEAIENKEVEPVTLTDEEKESMDNMLPFPGETDEMPEPIDVPDKPIDEKEVQSPDLKETYKEVSDEIKTRRLRVMTSEEDVKALEDAGVGNEIIGRIKADLEDPEVTGRYVPELGEVLLYDEHIKNLGLDKDEQRGVIYHEHVHGLEREGFTKENFADTARLIEEANKEFAEAVREDHKDKDKDVQDEEILGYLIQDIIRKGYKDALFDGTLDVGSEELNKRLYEIGKLLRGIKDGREREKESEVSVADEGGSRPDDQERVDEAPIEDTEAQETGRDEYLKPRNEKEEKIISDVEARLAEDIKAKEEEVRKAKADLEKAKARESDKATDIFANDETFREEDQIFSSEEMGLDTSVEGVEKRTKAERDALAAAEQELDRLRSQAEHDARVRGALDNERRQTSIDPMAKIEETAKEFSEEKKEKQKELGITTDETPEQIAETEGEAMLVDEPLLTEGDIDSTSLSSVQKTWAKAYLKGRTDNELYLEAYLEAKEDVRNRRQDNEGGSPDADGTQLAGTDDRTERGSGRTGEPSVNMADGTDVSGKESGIAEQGGVSGVEDRPVDVPVTSGERGDSRVPEQKPEVDRLSAGGEQSVGGSGARSDGSAVRPDGAGQRGSGVAGQVGERDIKTRRADLKNRRDELLARLRELKSKEKESGRLQMAVLPPIPSGISSFIPKDKEQRKVFWELATTTADYGYTYLEEGLTKFKEWKDKIVEDFVEPIRDFFGWGQNEVDRYIEQVWASDYEINGVTRTMAEWASFLEPKKLKGYVAKDIKSKYEAQLAAESVETKVGDIDNIRESLPYLLPEQHGDVLKAEQQFFDEKHQDREHAYGKGMMFTNGTGTGKTYTGLGIVKRFVKQGKGRVLILTPNQTKVNDWRMDGQNLGLDLESLDEDAKMKGTSATKAKGSGVVVTTYANARQNLKMLEDCFDLIVYDESQTIMKNKEASATTMADFHEMLTNKNVERSIDRQTYWLPEWIEYRDLTREVEDIRGQLDKLDNDGSQEAIDTRIRLNARMVEIQNRFEELRPIMTEIRESKRPQAEIDSKRTKVVFLSATPFNVRESLRYAEGYLFSYPEEDKNTIGSYNHRSPEDMFMEQMFPAGYRWRYGRLENHVSNAEALGRQEVQFSDYLQNTLRTLSGRTIASDYDYSRDFPIMTLDHAGRFNQAMSEVYRNKKYNKLSEAFRKCFDYNYSTALFEAMKTSLVTERIKEHLKRGQKVVVFHRRRTSGGLEPPFRRALNYAEELAEKDQNPKTKSELLSAIKAFETDFADMLEWEKKIDYTLPREQLRDVFGEDNVGFFSGAQEDTGKKRKKAIEDFMKDEGGKNIIVIQEASGSMGLSLHDQTGRHQRVMMSLCLPQSPIDFIQTEGRIYRIGNMSNAIFEYPLLGLDLETSLFAQRFNSALGTTENLALGSQARNLRKSIAESVLMNTGEVDYDHQGLGGKDMDGRVADPGDKDGFDIAIQDYYGNQKISRGRDNREGVDYFPTPEPIGYKMVEFGQMLEGETALEPSAGHGAIARYVPETNGLTAVEPSASLFTKLQMRAGGPGRRFEEMTFEEYPLANKHDVILMNPPYGNAGTTAMEHVAKAFRHLNEGGRIVAIIPNGPAMDKRMNAWLESKELNGSAVVTGEMILPNIAFGRAGTNVWTRMVVIDKVTRPEMRKNMPEKIGYDFSRETDINELFERIRNTRMPERTIDQVAINEKRVRRTEKQLSDNPFVTSTFIGTDYMDKPIMSVTTRSSDRSLGMRFSLSNYSMDDVLDTYKTVKEYGEDPESVDWGKWKNREFGRGKDKVKATDAIRDYCDTAIKTIENLTRMTSDQLDKALTEREEERARKRKEQEEKWKREQAEREARAEEERRQRIAKREAAKEALKENFSGDDLETIGHMIDLAHQEIFGARRYREMLKNRGVDWETGKKITTPRVVLRESYNEKMPLDLGTMETLMDIAETSIDSRRKDAAKRALEMSGIHSDTGEEKENFDYSSHDEYYEKELRDFLEKASFTVKLKTKAQKAEEAEVYKRLEAEAKAKANTDERQNRSDYEYALDKNTRTGDDMHLVKYNGARLGSEEYKSVERKAKANGGYYNRFKKAWHFPTEEDARKFVDGMTNVTNNTDNGAVRFSEVKDKEKLNNRGEDMESEKKNVSLPQNNVKYEEGDRERVFAGNEAVMRTVAETSDSGVRDSSTEEAGRGSGSKESLLRDVVRRAQENGTWRDSIDDEVLRRAERLSKKLNAPVKVATSANDVTNREASEAIRSGRKIQGWYDTKTGEVTLYLPNIKNTYDGEKVISHEIIGHKGMRDLLGENGYKSYMRSLLFDLKDKDLSEYLAKNLSRNGFDIYRTVDEFLAEAAERGYGDLPMWQKVKEKLTDALRSIGFTMSPSISDVKYMVWLSKHNLERGNIMNKVERDALLYKLGKERYSANVKDGEYTYSKEKTNDVPYFPGNGETLFRQTPSIKNQRQNYERALKRLGYVWKEAHIDAMQSAVELMRSISGIKKIEDIPSAENFVLLENQMSSKEEQMDYLFNRDYMEPLDKAVSDILPDMGGDIDDQLRNLQLYMIKKHGLERNRVLFVRDAIRALRKDSAVDQSQVDQLEADYNKTVGILRDDLRLGVTDLKDYFEDMDDWIRANIDPDYKPGEKDYSGLTDLYGEGYDEAQVLDDIMSTESMLGEDRVNNLWDKTKAVSQFGLDMEYEGGLDSREKHDKVSDMFEWYVPLRGYEEKSAEDVYDYLEENGGGRKWAGPVLANAKGRESLADVDVFATLGAMSSSAINRALRNQMKQAFARFVRNHYNEVDADKRLVTELPYLWAEKQTTAGNEEWVEKFPDIPEGASADKIADILDRYNQDMQMLEAQGLAKRVRQNANLPFRPAKAENKAQHIVDVWINGEKHPFIINGNPRAAQAINGQLKGERKGNLLWLSDLSHFMAKMNTSYSPDFIMRNTERDLFFSAANIAVKENFKYWKNWAKNYAVATGRVAAGVPGMETNLFNRYRNDNLDMSNPTDRYFKEFMENGGETGFVEQKNLDKWKKIIKEGVKKDSKAEEIGKKIVNALPDVIEAMNERAENLARFATYMTSRQMGRTITRSVSDAKEVSVNFNRKGSGSKVVGMNKGESHRPKWATSANDYLAGWSAQNLQDYLMFYNAGVQGINNMTKSVVNNPVKGAAAMAAFALAGMIMPRLNQFLYEEDDDKSGKEPENPYAELPEYVRRNNLCIYGNNGSFLTVALPIELRAFYGLGDMAASYISNPELRSTRNAGVDILSQLSQIMPVNFLEGGDFSLWNLSPSGAAPLLEAARNENWLGQPIERGETPWNVYDPRWTRAFKNVSDVYVGASKRLNAATNPYNDENIKGWADGAITDPALVEHVVNGYFGGVGSTVNRVAQLAKHAGEMSPKDAITSNWMPIVRTQHFTPDERTRYARTRNKWYYYKEEAEKTDKVIKALKKRGEADPLSFMQAVSEEEGRKGTRSEIMKAAEKQYNHIKKIMDAETDLQQKNLYQLQMDQIMEQTVKELDKIK